MKLGKVKNVSYDFILNLCASILSTGVSQIILYPFLARYMTSAQYGVVLTVVGIANIAIGTCGGSLNNTRLLLQNTYDSEQIEGDFNPLLLILSIVGTVSCLIVFLFLNETNPISTPLILAYVLLATIRGYSLVFYRIHINFKRILISNTLIATGVIVGVIILRIVRTETLWPIPFVLGEITGLAYIFATTGFLKEHFDFTKLFKLTIKKEALLFLTTLLADILIYFDRLLLYPVLGSEAVSAYTVASFFGKTIGVVMIPMASVLLSYYSQRNYVMTRKKFWVINSITVTVSTFFFVACIILSPFFTKLFYPTLIDAARDYLVIANFAAIVNAASNMTQPAVLRYAPTHWQLTTQALYTISYIGLGLIFAKRFALSGFCIAALCSNLLRLLILYIVGDVSVRKQK